MLYWRIGKLLSEKIAQEGWGSKTMKRLEVDLKQSFPNVSGFSIRNLHYMRKFAERFPVSNCAAAT
jgi:predicted nuclease of restriction endonuclease-like (RecB) superfamily